MLILKTAIVVHFGDASCILQVRRSTGDDKENQGCPENVSMESASKEGAPPTEGHRLTRSMATRLSLKNRNKSKLNPPNPVVSCLQACNPDIHYHHICSMIIIWSGVSMVWYKTAVTLLLMHWSYCSSFTKPLILPLRSCKVSKFEIRVF